MPLESLSRFGRKPIRAFLTRTSNDAAWGVKMTKNDSQERRYILLDVGGTGVKGAYTEHDGTIAGYREFPSGSDRDGKGVFDHFAEILTELSRNYGSGSLSGIGFAFPGPFDYENGISLMKGIGKYDRIYGMSFPKELEKRIPSLSQVRMLFLHDIEAFGIGCVAGGIVPARGRTLCLCIGTGAGSCFLVNGRPVKPGTIPGGEKDTTGIPANGWIYNTPFKDSIIDDYLSERGLETLALSVTGRRMTGKELASAAAGGSRKARDVFDAFGENLALAMEPFLSSFRPQTVVMGGKIAESFPFFGSSFEKICRERGVQIRMENKTSIRAMQGLETMLDLRPQHC